MDSLMQAIAKFMLFGTEEHVMKHAVLEAAGKEFLERAKAAIGTYEYNWTPLAEDTISRKQHGDTPLLETGAMRDSGFYEVHGAMGVTIGFSDPKIVWHEFGTKHIPPRPVVGGTIEHHGQEIADHMGVIFGMILGEALAVGNIGQAASSVLGGK